MLGKIGGHQNADQYQMAPGGAVWSDLRCLPAHVHLLTYSYIVKPNFFIVGQFRLCFRVFHAVVAHGQKLAILELVRGYCYRCYKTSFFEGRVGM